MFHPTSHLPYHALIPCLAAQLGVLTKDEAIAAAVEKGLDLVLISPNSDPPVDPSSHTIPSHNPLRQSAHTCARSYCTCVSTLRLLQVCKILNYDKFRFASERKRKTEAARSKSSRRGK